MKRFVIRGGEVLDNAGAFRAGQDLLIEDGKVLDLLPSGAKAPEGTQELEANDCWVMPGLVDLHVHLREPGFEWKETIQTGVEAAALGGYTSICCMPNTKPVNHNAEITRFILEQAFKAGLSRVHPIGAVSHSLEGTKMSPLSELREAGCVAFSDDGEPVWDSLLMRRALEWCKMLGVRISCHEEDKRLSCGGCMNESALSLKLGLAGWPKVAEEVMIARDIELARATKSKIHICHVSTARGVELIRRAKNDGIDITAEVTPHHLVLDQSAVGNYDTHAKMSPPLREADDLLALRLGVNDGTIDAIASDHAPHEDDSKRVEFGKASFGILGLQTNLSLVLGLVKEGALRREAALSALSYGPAKAFGLPFGSIVKGAAADLTIVAPNEEWTFAKEAIRSKSFNSPFIGRRLSGRARHVVVGGSVKVQNFELVTD